jgi:hypothetical protein
MRSVRVFALAAACALALPVLALADAPDDTVYTSTTGVFRYALAGLEDTNPVVNGLGTPGLSFGRATQPGFAQTRLYFAGAFDYGGGPDGDFRDIYNPPDPFFLGTLFIFNGRIDFDSGISAVFLALRTDLSAPSNPGGDGVGIALERLGITNTINVAGDRIASADYFTFTSLRGDDGLPLAAYVYEGEEAYFNLYGTLNSPLAISRIDGDGEHGFVGSAPEFDFTSLLAVAVPEPAAWALLLVGFGGVGVALRSRRRSGLLITGPRAA